ncbi:hypothetical protein niasHT_032668 [Heterodera trifolii]|uniref:Uncharacterized protein n=1 Tax=Heterodera trifolii TaxID=157864 RepID=A0ABD2IWV0_9BILA
MIRIWSKIGENGTMEMEIANNCWKPMPIPQIQMPRKIVRFERIQISYIDQNAITFFHRLRPLFASFCPINLSIVCINMSNDHHTLELILRNIGPMIARNICAIQLSVIIFRHLRQFVLTILNDCPLLCAVITDFGDLFPEFPADDSAMALDGQALAKWLFTPLQNDVPKVFNCYLCMNDGNFASKIEPFKAAFANASFLVNSIIVILFDWSFVDSVMPFDQTNGLTGEQLALKRINDSNCFVSVRCPIVRDMDKWAKWEKEAMDGKLMTNGT